MHEVEREFIEWELLWLRCRRGDPDVIEALVQKLERPLYYFIRRIVGNEADAWDVLQQSWVRVLTGMKSVADARTLKPWIYRTARNTAMNHIRAGRRYRATIENNTAPSNSCDTDAMEFDNAEQVHRALDQLELPYREALTLYFLEQLTVLQMAEILDIPEGTVKSRLYHGKRRLREILESNDEK